MTPLNFVPATKSRVPHTLGFPVKFVGVGEPYAAFLNESRTRCRRLGPRTGNPGISLVFCEMWDTTALDPADFLLSLGPERTRISCHAAPDTTTYAAFIKESRRKLASATNLNRKSGVAQWRDLRYPATCITDFSLRRDASAW
jgi:hypothetical protein